MSAWGNEQATGAENRATASYLAQQNGVQQDALGQFNKSLQLVQPGAVSSDIASDTAARANTINQLGGTAGISVVPGQRTGFGSTQESGAVKNALAQQNGINSNELGTEAAGRAAIGGTGDTFAGIDRGMIPQAEKIALDQSFLQDNQNAFDLEYQQASQAGSGLRSLGSLFSGVGQAGLLAAGAGLFSGAGAGASAGADGASAASAETGATMAPDGAGGYVPVGG
jgi:hypothetical protein